MKYALAWTVLASLPLWAQEGTQGGGIPPDQFDKLFAMIRPKPDGFDELPWMTSLWEARKKAAAEDKPIYLWIGTGHPLGIT